MAIENAKNLNVRIKNKYDSYENWAASGLVLEAGEIAIAYSTVDVQVDNGTVRHPFLLMKVGDGEETFSKLPWLSAKAADVLEACKSDTGLTAYINNVIANAGIATDDAMQELAGKVTTAEGEIDALQADLNTAETGLKAKMATAEAAIEAIEGKFGYDTVSAEINAAITALNLGNTYEAKGEAAKVQTALNEYKTSNDAAVLANTNNITANNNAINAIKDGTAIDSFADVEAALAGKETSGAAAQALVDAKAYADGLAGNYDTKGAAATAESNAKTYAKEYADGLAGNYDAAGSAAQALVDAKAYTDGFTGGKTVSAYVGEVIANYSTTTQMNSAIATAKGEAVSHANGLNTAMDERVQALEAIDHTHSFVESELNLIQTGDVAKWNAAEQNAKDYAKDYADGLDEVMDGRVAALEAKFTGEDSVADQIANAVAAEAALREAADAALQGQIGEASAEGKAATGLHARIEELESLTGGSNVAEAINGAINTERERAEGIEGGLRTDVDAIKADYLKAADKEALQTQINTIMSNPDAEGAINSINEFTQYINEHKPVAEAFRTDINQNATDIAAEIKRAGEAEAELEGAINDVATDLETLDGVVATKAAQADLNTLAGRVTTIETEHNAESTGLKARLTQAEADIDALDGLIGGSSVSGQILAVTDPLTARVVELEKVDHSHENAAELDKIVDGDKAKWDAAVQTVTAGTGLTATKTGTDVAIAFDDTVTFIFDCGGAV